MRKIINRKESIILSAIDIIDNLGFQGLSIKEISVREGIAEGTLYKHFRSKDEVVLAVLDYYSKFDEDIKQTIELKELSCADSIRFFISRFAEYYQNYPEMTAIYNSFEVFRNEANLAAKISEIFEYRSAILINIVKEGVYSGEFNLNTDCENLSDIILGSCREITLKWRMRKYNFDLKERLLSTLDMILNAYLIS